jgi:hypothetical protein
MNQLTEIGVSAAQLENPKLLCCDAGTIKVAD